MITDAIWTVCLYQWFNHIIVASSSSSTNSQQQREIIKFNSENSIFNKALFPKDYVKFATVKEKQHLPLICHTN